MKHTIKAAAAAALMAASSMATAIGVGNNALFTNLSWGVTTNSQLLAGCADLRLDLTGDLASGKFGLFGYMTCNSGVFPVVGSGYSANGLWTLSFMIGVNPIVMACPNLQGLSGNCSVYSGGALNGTSVITFR